MVRKDFGVSGKAITWVDRDNLIEVIPGLRYQTPDRFYENTLAVFLNGVRVEKNNADGFTVNDDRTFTMRNAFPLPAFRVSVGYVKKFA